MAAKQKTQGTARAARASGFPALIGPFVIAMGIAHTAACAQCIQQKTIEPSEPSGNASFGSSIAMDGNVALVGSNGAAYVFRHQGSVWVEEARLVGSDVEPGDAFGQPVAMDGNVAFVGAWNQNCSPGINCGAVYVFQFDGTDWVEAQKLVPNDVSTGDQFGLGISVRNGRAIIGAPGDGCTDGPGCGSAYFFRLRGASWVQEQKLVAAERFQLDIFGVQVTMEGETAFIGATGADCGGYNCGFVYVFRFDGSTWIEHQKLIASDAGVTSHTFGGSVSLDGEIALIGSGTGAYIFRFDGANWSEEQKLITSDNAIGQLYGVAGALSGELVVVGAGGVDCPMGEDCGAAYIFRHEGASWKEQKKLFAPSPKEDDRFGIAVASGESVLIGTNGKDCLEGFNCGAVYVYSCPGVPALTSSGKVALALVLMTLVALFARRKNRWWVAAHEIKAGSGNEM